MKAALIVAYLALYVSFALSLRITLEHTSIVDPPAEWKVKQRAHPSTLTHFTVAVSQTNRDELERRFWEVSDPKNEHYAEYMTLDEVNALVSPKPESIKAITSWLLEHSITQFHVLESGDFLRATATVAQAETLLEATYYVYQHAITGDEIVRVGSGYSVPSEVAEHIDFIGGLAYFPKNHGVNRQSKLAARAPRSPQLSVTPDTIKTFFNIDPSTVGTQSNNSQAVAQFLQQYYDPTDLSAFQKQFSLAQQPVTKVVGPNDPGSPGVEASLDIEYIMGVAPGIATWFVYTDGLVNGQEPFLDWVVGMSNTPTAPWVHSVSYGDVESSVSKSYTDRVDAEFQKYGLVGRSILFASGDDGTGCSACKKFVPNWPASSAYVTSVGGFEFNTATTVIGDYISSGGFSNYYAMPAYQQQAVNAYLSSQGGVPQPSFYNASGRAMPDVSSFSEDVLIVVYGSINPVAGTSCAAPVFAGVIALINDARLAAKKAPLGFLNPFIYQTLATHPDAFIDVLMGANPNGCCGKGFSCAKGWDPVTGAGGPNFPNLKQYALAM